MSIPVFSPFFPYKFVLPSPDWFVDLYIMDKSLGFLTHLFWLIKIMFGIIKKNQHVVLDQTAHLRSSK